MNLLKKTTLFVVSGILLGMGVFAQNAEEKAKDILKKTIDHISPEFFQAEIEMTYLRADGTNAKYAMILKNKKYTRSHVTFIAPEREKNRQTLRIDDNLWSYMPKTNKVVQMSFDADFMGGDFSNQDIVRLNLLEDYTPALIKETDSQYILDLSPNNKGFLYAKIRYWVRKKDNMPLQAYFFSRAGNPLRKLEYKQLKNYSGFIRPSVYEMTNLAENTKTFLTFTSFKKMENLPDSLFYKENLGKF